MAAQWDGVITLARNEEAGTLSGTSKVVAMGSMSNGIPRTLTLKFAALTTQKIELSTDGGTEYFEPSYAASSATMKVVTIGAPVTHVKFTGVAGNTWSIR